MGGRVAGVDEQAALEGGYGLVDLVQGLVDAALVVQVDTVAGVEGDCFLEVVQGLLVVLEFVIDESDAIVGRGETGVEGDGLLEILETLLGARCFQQERPQVEQDDRVVRHDADGLPVVTLRLLQLP